MKLFTLLLLLALSGCASVAYVSSYNQQTRVPVTKAFILCSDMYTDTFLHRFAIVITTKLQQRNIQAKLVVVNELTFITPDDIEESIKNFNHDVVITLNRGTSNLQDVKEHYYWWGCYLGVRKNGDKTDYWKALINVQGQDFDDYINNTANSILDKFMSETEK
jgi:hypothetical protein